MTRLLAVAFALMAVPASAQRIEFSPLLFGYSTASEIEPTADRVSTLEIESGHTWGAQFGYLLTSHVEIEGMWTRRATGVSMETPTSEATTLFFMTTNELAANVVYRFQLRPNRLQPFIFAGGGVARMTLTDLDPVSKLTWNLGGGVTWFVFKHVGIRVDGRYNLLAVSSADSTSCTPLKFCQDALKSTQFATGMALRF